MTEWLKQGHDLYPARRWYAVYVQPRREIFVAERATEHGIETYVPMCREPKYLKCGKLNRYVTSVLLPRYVLARFNLGSDPWAVIRRTHGQVHIAGTGDSPSPIPDSVIDELRSRESDGVIKVAHADPERPFAADEAVRAHRGPFAGHIGRVIRCERRDRSTVFFAGIWGGQNIEMPNADLTVLD